LTDVIFTSESFTGPNLVPSRLGDFSVAGLSAMGALLGGNLGFMFFQFSNPVSGAGAFLSYFSPGDPTVIEALDAAGTVLESYTVVVPNPATGAFNDVAFRGIVRPTADISSIRVGNNPVAVTTLVFSQVPEPSTAVMLRRLRNRD
jgi:hypothetical protein